MRRFICAAALLLASATYTTLIAQSLAVGASLGWYRPLRDFHLGQIASTDLPRHASELAGIAWGGEARWSFRERLGIEAILATAAGTVPSCSCPGGFVVPPTGERVDVAAVEGLYRVPLRGRNEVSFGLGPALIEHAGEGYHRYGSPKSWGGAGDIEATHALTSHLEASARALASAYSFRLDFPPQSGPQLDLLMSVSVRWRLRAVSHARSADDTRPRRSVAPRVAAP